MRLRAGWPALVTLACAARPVHIPEAAPTRQNDSSADLSLPSDVPSLDLPAPRLQLPASREQVLAVLALFQSSIASGDPPLEALLSESAGLTAPGVDGRRTTPSRTAIASALNANFVAPELYFDPLEVSVRAGERAEIMTVPLETASSSSPRRIVLSLEVGYDAGALRIQDITLSRTP